MERKQDHHYEVYGQFEKPHQRAQLTITTNDLLVVRPLHSRRLYALPLGTVAEMVVSKVTKSDLHDQGISTPRARR